MYVRSASGQRWVAVINLIVAAGPLIGAMVGLFHVTDPSLKLAIVSVLILLFGDCMFLMTNARTAKVFGATAAYAAVLVVFISSGLMPAP